MGQREGKINYDSVNDNWTAKNEPKAGKIFLPFEKIICRYIHVGFW